MSSNQVKFEFEIENLESDMEEFFQNYDFKQFQSIFEEAQKINKTLKE